MSPPSELVKGYVLMLAVVGLGVYGVVAADNRTLRVFGAVLALAGIYFITRMTIGLVMHFREQRSRI